MPLGNRKIVIFGSTGQLGTELERLLGRKAVGLSRNQCDIASLVAVRKAILKHKPDIVINTAGYTAVDAAERDQEACNATNVAGAYNLAKACSDYGITFLTLSTDYVFGSDRGRKTPYREEEPTSPAGVYAKSKVAGEESTRLHDNHFIVRTCGLYSSYNGLHQYRNFTETMIRLSKELTKLRVVADQHCTPSYVPHVAQAIIELLETNQYGTYHIVNSGATTWYDFAKELFKQLGINVDVQPITSEEYASPVKRPAYSVLDIHKLQKVIGRAMPTWQDGINQYLATRKHMPLPTVTSSEVLQ